MNEQRANSDHLREEGQQRQGEGEGALHARQRPGHKERVYLHHNFKDTITPTVDM